MISGEFRSEVENATEEESLIAAEVNQGQNTKRGIFRAELARRQRIKQEEALTEQLQLSREAVKAAARSAIATGLAAVAAAGSLAVAVINLIRN